MSAMKAMLIAFLIGVACFAIGRTGLSRKPSEDSLVNVRAKEPVQTMIADGSPEAAPIHLEFEKRRYTLYPRAQYAIEGLIVSQHRSDSAFDLAHARTGDTLNSRDICTVWGRMLAGGVYRDVKFWSGDWTCYYQPANYETAAVFKPDQVSNTHVLATDPGVREALARLETGDEYRMRGRLVDYELEGAGRRNTSLVRTDTDNGACEVMFVESVEVLRSHNRTFGFIRDAGFYLALAALVGIIGMMLRSIFFGRSAVFFWFFVLFSSAFLGVPERAHAKLCNASTEYCGDGMGSASSSSSGSASRGGRIRLNPAVLPVDKGFGIETIYFDSSVDFALVKGFGRVGAAISPSASEETFFGPPGFESSTDLLTRKQGHHKFKSQKYTLAGAFNIVNNRKSGFDRFAVNLGGMVKYNTISKQIKPGLGITGILGPLSFGYSRYGDQYAVDAMDPVTGQQPTVFDYNVETYSIGAFVGPIILDYSLMRFLESDDSKVSMLTGTLLWDRAIITASIRTENITRMTYSYEKNMLEITPSKTEYFAGFQYTVWDSVLLGVFYNYYLVRDISLGVTVFF